MCQLKYSSAQIRCVNVRVYVYKKKRKDVWLTWRRSVRVFNNLMQIKTKECVNLLGKVSSCVENGTGDRASSKGKDVPAHLI